MKESMFVRCSSTSLQERWENCNLLLDQPFKMAKDVSIGHINNLQFPRPLTLLGVRDKRRYLMVDKISRE